MSIKWGRKGSGAREQKGRAWNFYIGDRFWGNGDVQVEERA